MRYVLFTAALLAAATHCPPQARGPVGPYLGGRMPATQDAWRVVPAFPHLRFHDALGLLPVPRSNKLIVFTRQGQVWSFENDPAVRDKEMFLDISSHCQGWDDSGLLGMAFHPEFGKEGSPNRGHVYAWYVHTEKPSAGPGRPKKVETPLYDRLSRFTVPEGSAAADPKSELVLIDQHDQHFWHNGGGMFFNPDDGFLYVSTGDEGGEFGNEQRIDKDLFCGVLRIDVDCDSKRSHTIPRQPADGKTAHYFIPNDNPWVGVPGALEEFYAIGFRSPHRMSYDAPTKTIWLADVGWTAREEVNLVVKGGNYGWRYREGTLKLGPKPEPYVGEEQDPLFEYPRRLGASITGGYVYRGRKHPDLAGQYLFGDYQGPIWALDAGPGREARLTTLCPVPPSPNGLYVASVASFGIDHAGEIYICQMGDGGQILTLARSPSPRPLPALLSETGAFEELRSLKPAPGLVPYDVNVPSWTDGATATRWIAVPNDGAPYGEDERAAFAPRGEWSFPAGTVFVQHLAMGDRRLETRLLVRDAEGGVYGAAYRWKPDGGDAELVRESATVEVELPAGGKQTWLHPGPRECLTCHTPASGGVLGVKTRQLNRMVNGEEQLRAWKRLGLCEVGENEFEGLDRLAPPEEGGAPLEQRVRSYLDANCSGCHRPGGAHAYFDARYDTPLKSAGIIRGGLVNPPAGEKARLVEPGDPPRSMLYRRMMATEEIWRMPPLGRHRVDGKAASVLAGWILSLQR